MSNFEVCSVCCKELSEDEFRHSFMTAIVGAMATGYAPDKEEFEILSRLCNSCFRLTSRLFDTMQSDPNFTFQKMRDAARKELGQNVQLH